MLIGRKIKTKSNAAVVLLCLRAVTKSGMNKHEINHAELSSLAMKPTKSITKFQVGALKDERVLVKCYVSKGSLQISQDNNYANKSGPELDLTVK